MTNPTLNCLFCLKVEVLAKPSEPDWDIKIKHIGQPFFTTFKLHCDYWESFKKSHFCSECFGRLEELRFLLRKIDVIQADVNQLKKHIGSTVKASTTLVSEFRPTRTVGPEDIHNGIYELRKHISAYPGFEYSPSVAVSELRSISSCKAMYANGGLPSASRGMQVPDGIERPAEPIPKDSESLSSPKRSLKRPFCNMSPTSSSILRDYSKNPRLEIYVAECEPNSPEPNLAGANEFTGSSDLSQSILQPPRIHENDKSIEGSTHQEVQLPVPVPDPVDSIDEVDIGHNSVDSSSESIGTGPSPPVEDRDCIQSQGIEDYEVEDNYVSSTYTVNRAEEEYDAVSPLKLTYTVPKNKSSNDGNEISPFRSTYKVQDSNTSSNKESSSTGSDEMWKSHQVLVPSVIGVSDAENTFSDHSKNLEPKDNSTIRGDSTFYTQEQNLNSATGDGEAVVTSSQDPKEPDMAEAEGAGSDLDEVYYDSNEIMYETQGGRVPAPESIESPDSEEIIEIPKKAKRKRRSRKQKRLFDAPESMFLCVSKGCKAIWNSDELLQQHIEIDHNGELQQNDCELCLLKTPTAGPTATSTPAENSTIQMCHDAKNCDFKCDVCPDTFLTMNCKDFHQSRHRRRGTITFTRCTECNKDLDTPAGLRNHLTLHSLILSCGSCKETFTTLLDLQIHTDIYHAISAIERQEQRQRKTVIEFQCTNCHQKFPDNRSLTLHLRTHEFNVPEVVSKRFKCPNCPKTYELEKYLSYHQLYCMKKIRRKRRKALHRC